MRKKITADQAVRALKDVGLSTSAAALANRMGADSRAIATALRKPTKDGRVSIVYRKGVGFYRFKRLRAKAVKP